MEGVQTGRTEEDNAGAVAQTEARLSPGRKTAGRAASPAVAGAAADA